MKTLALINPAAGGGRARAQVAPALRRLHAELDALEVVWTEHPGHASALAQRAAQDGVQRFLVGGGDGSVFEALNGLFPRPESAPRLSLGILPLGTGNSFVRDFGLTELDAAVDAILAGHTRPVDLIALRHRDGLLHYINLCAIGFPADAGELTNRRFKALGLGGYAVSVVICVSRLSHPRFPVSLDGGAVDDQPCTFLSFSNSRFTGGTMEMAPPADVSDGLLDLIRVGPMGRRRLLGAFPKIYSGAHLALPEISHQTAASVDFHFDAETDCMIDGEILRLSLRSLRVLPGALDFLA